MAQYMLGVLYETGAGVEKDTDKALEWLRKAAAQKYPGAAERIEKVQKGETNSQPAPSADSAAKNDAAQPSQAENMLRTGMSLLKLGNVKQARTMFNNAVRLDPSLKPKVDEALREHGETP